MITQIYTNVCNLNSKTIPLFSVARILVFNFGQKKIAFIGVDAPNAIYNNKYNGKDNQCRQHLQGKGKC